MEKQAIEQAQNFLRRYGLLPPTTPPANLANPASPSNNSGGDIVTIPVVSMEQADNAPVDAFRTFIYPNFPGNEIYVKKLDESGKPLTQIFLPRGSEITKVFDDISKRILDSLVEIDKRLKAIEAKTNG